MKQFFHILKFELSNYTKNKAFIGITLVLIILIAGVLFFPRIASVFEKEDSSQPQQTEKSIVAFSDLTGDARQSSAFLNAAMPDKDFQVIFSNAQELEQKVRDGEYGEALILSSPTSYTYITAHSSMYDTTQQQLNGILQQKYRMDTMQELGISPEQASELMGVEIQSQIVNTGKDQMQSFFYTYVLIFALYMAILLYGQFVAQSVASEKSSRAMEILITSAKPTQLMFGKVIGSGLAGLIQLVAIFGSGYVFYNLNKSYWAGNMIIDSIFDMPISILGYTILFFILGYFIYSFMYGALGSLASRSEDINTSIMPVTFLFIIAFFVVMFSMGSGNVDTPLMIACSYIPFTSPMAMFVRIAMGNVQVVEIILSVAILIVSTIGIGYLSAGIYRMGVLLYGKPPKLGELFKTLAARKKKA